MTTISINNLPKAYSSVLNFHYTRQDAEQYFNRIAKAWVAMGNDLNTLDWKKLQRSSGDNIATLTSILERKAKETK